jgi:RNA polymerase sigma-70 factor (ECF subfamily)
MESVTDTCYIEKIQAGETECFAFLLKRYSRPVFSLIVKIVGNREDAEELTQDVFLKAYRSLASFQGNSSFSTWLYRIACNTAVSATRKKKHEWLPVEEAALENVAEDVTETLAQADSEEQLARLEQALEQLLPDERALILLFYMQEKTVEEMASITGLTLSNVKVRLHRIRKKMFVIMKAMK